MKLARNIDERGKRARLVGGAIVGVCGVALLVTGFLTHILAMIIGGAFLCVTGAFMIFEGIRSWCVLRAVGIKTPM